MSQLSTPSYPLSGVPVWPLIPAVHVACLERRQLHICITKPMALCLVVRLQPLQLAHIVSLSRQHELMQPEKSTVAHQQTSALIDERSSMTATTPTTYTSAARACTFIAASPAFRTRRARTRTERKRNGSRWIYGCTDMYRCHLAVCGVACANRHPHFDGGAAGQFQHTVHAAQRHVLLACLPR